MKNPLKKLVKQLVKNSVTESPHQKVQDLVTKWVGEGLVNNGVGIESACDKAWKEIQKEVPECSLHIFGKYWTSTYNFQRRYFY
jgi:hypothetical protein